MSVKAIAISATILTVQLNVLGRIFLVDFATAVTVFSFRCFSRKLSE